MNFCATLKEQYIFFAIVEKMKCLLRGLDCIEVSTMKKYLVN